ncbi:ATP-binding protein [Terrihabitans rhizophilus]|uniref:histidine kinase n=1 Tax=Terrihabitans rhizophilus TaxID=3092662 RepID=A0ABU4RLZ1_9HYPH|nr:ATP-binding protein [Terrihabitans sp. PJ23]MDX6805834.1 ATP-binding protein [Terrihabitans sp. PJ23]
MNSAEAGSFTRPINEEALARRKNLLLLIQLRWTAVIGQIATILAVYFGLGIELPWRPMAAVLAGLVLLNLLSLLSLWRKAEVSNEEIFGTLIFDVAALTAQLYLSGGATNPFVFLFLLQVTLAAVLLDAWTTWALAAIIALCFAGLTLEYVPLDLPPDLESSLFSLHVDGMLISFALNAVLIIVFVKRITQNVRERDERLADLRQRRAEEDHIVRMGLLASGAAHELGTPLSTMSVILGDWKRMPALKRNPELGQEIEDMQAQVQRCKAIVTGTLLQAGETRSESAAATSLCRFLDDLVDEWRTSRGGAQLAYDNRCKDDLRIVSDTGLKQVIFNVLDNAHEVSPGRVRFTAAREAESLVLAVSDEGPGFLPDMLKDLGTPYKTSKGSRGRGVGLFLLVNAMRKLGGHVEAVNRPQGGATVTMTMPLHSLAVARKRDDR